MRSKRRQPEKVIKMSAISGERGDFLDFVRGGDIWSKWDGARRLMATRQMQSATNKEGFAQSFRDLGKFAVDGSGIEQLLAIALIVRISDLVKGDLRREAGEILSHALIVPIEGFWTIGETKNLPLVSKPSEIRENVASALSYATGTWVIPYVVEALAREEKSARCRLELTRQLARREIHFSRWLKMLSEISWLDISQSEKADRIPRLGELATALVAGLREHGDVVVDEETGPALAVMMQRVAPMSPRGQRSAKLGNVGLALIKLLDEVLTMDFALIADPEAYAALAVIARWWQPSPYPQSIHDGLASVVRKLTSAIRLRARLGQKSESLTLRLRQALGAGGSMDELLLKIAETESGLAPEIDDWLRGRERENSATATAISSLLSEANAPSVVESVASLLLEFTEAEASDLSRLQSQVHRIHSRVLNLAAELRLVIVGAEGEIVEFNPTAHRTVTGAIPPDPIVCVRRPMVIRRRDDGSQDIIERAIVE
jgi:hypothetical protein